MKKVLCVVLAALMLLSMAACGQKSIDRLGENGAYYIGNDAGKNYLKANPNTLDPASIYSKLNYTEQMFHGNYELANKEDALEDFAASVQREDLEYSQTYSLNSAEENLVTHKLSTLPVSIELGTDNNYYAGKLRGEHEWAELRLLNERNYEEEVLCTYTVSGNTISFFPLDAFVAEQD